LDAIHLVHCSQGYLSPFILDFVVLLVEVSNVIFLKNNYFLIEKLLALAEQASACWNCHTLVVSDDKKKSLMPCTPSVADIISPVIISFFFLPSFLSSISVNTL
jgi:hypothetical protein